MITATACAAAATVTAAAAAAAASSDTWIMFAKINHKWNNHIIITAIMVTNVSKS